MPKYPNPELGNEPKENFFAKDSEPQNPPKREPLPDSDKRPPLTEPEKQEFGKQIESLRPVIRRRVSARLSKYYPNDIDNVTSEIIVRAYEGIDSLSDNLKLEAWVGRITKNEIASFARKKGNILLRQALSAARPSEFGGTEPFEQPDPKGDPESLLLTKERNKIIKKAFDRLSPRYKEVLLLAYYEGYEAKEIMEKLGISESAVKLRLHRARKEMRRYLKEEGFEFKKEKF